MRCQQLRGVLRKNVLLKQPRGSRRCSRLPSVSMMALTVLLKDLSTQYDALSIAYTRGPARRSTRHSSVPGLAWLGCFERLSAARQAPRTNGLLSAALLPLPPPFDDLTGPLYGQLGYITFLSFTVGDERRRDLARNRRPWPRESVA